MIKILLFMCTLGADWMAGVCGGGEAARLRIYGHHNSVNICCFTVCVVRAALCGAKICASALSSEGMNHRSTASLGQPPSGNDAIVVTRRYIDSHTNRCEAQEKWSVNNLLMDVHRLLLGSKVTGPSRDLLTHGVRGGKCSQRNSIRRPATSDSGRN